MYTDIIIEHFTNPRNVGTMEDPDGYGRVESSVCGDLMEIYIKVDDGILADVKYRTFGCAAAIASSSIASEMMKGRPLGDVSGLSDEKVSSALGGLPDTKTHCSLLAVHALHKALEDYYQRHPESRPEPTGEPA